MYVCTRVKNVDEFREFVKSTFLQPGYFRETDAQMCFFFSYKFSSLRGSNNGSAFYYVIHASVV